MPAWSLPLALGAGELGADEAVGLGLADGLAGGTTPAGDALGELPALAEALADGVLALPFPPLSRPK